MWGYTTMVLDSSYTISVLLVLYLSTEEMYPSTLVFEIEDTERTRHIVALSQAHASKLRKRVTHARKLHIYNDHIFVATHLKQ